MSFMPIGKKAAKVEAVKKEVAVKRQEQPTLPFPSALVHVWPM